MQDPASNGHSVDPLQPTHGSYVDQYQPPVSQPKKSSEALEEQNIFALLGVNDGTDEEKEAFLLELQRVLWDDFLQYDVQLLITKDEYAQLQQIRSRQQSEEAKENAIATYLEKLIPDLEDIMLEKALELKGDMVRERISGLRELYADDTAKLALLATASEQVEANKWHSAAATLNTLSAS